MVTIGDVGPGFYKRVKEEVLVAGQVDRADKGSDGVAKIKVATERRENRNAPPQVELQRQAHAEQLRPVMTLLARKVVLSPLTGLSSSAEAEESLPAADTIGQARLVGTLQRVVGNAQIARLPPSRVQAMPKASAAVNNLGQTNQSSSLRDRVQLAQHPAAARQSRVAVTTSIQSFRTSYNNVLTRRLLARLRDRRQSVAGAAVSVGEGSRTFGGRPVTVPEPAGVTLGRTAAASETATRRAVVVGNGIYNQSATMGSSVLPLRGRNIATAVSDAAAMASMLQGRGYDVGPLHQDNQTAAQINALLRAGIAGLGAGDELVFYYHGHGTMEGLIGRDGGVYTPTQMAALRSTARGARVNLTLVLEGCHTGVFADAIRGAELRDTLAAMRARVRVTSGAVQYARQLLLPVLDNVIAIQVQKEAFNTRVQAWWARRYELDQQYLASPSNARLTAMESHYNDLVGIWNDFVTAVTPLLSTLRTRAIAAGFNVQLSQRITGLAGPLNVSGEQAIEAGLDDLDSILNRVLRETDSRLR